MNIRFWLAFLAALLLGQSAQAVPYAGRLSFDFSPCHGCYNLRQIGQDYGDVASVVDISYLNVLRPGQSLRMWDHDYNDLQNVAYASGGNGPGQSHGRIELRALSGRALTLTGVDFGAWINTTRISSIRVGALGAAQAAFSYDGAIGSGTTHTHFDFALEAADGYAIDWFGTATDVGIDNLAFTVFDAARPIPEPASLVMIGAGLGLLTLVIRRRRRQLARA